MSNAMAKQRKSRKSLLVPHDPQHQVSVDRIANGMRLLALMRKRRLQIKDGCDVMTTDAKNPGSNTFVKLRRIGSSSSYGEAHLVVNIEDRKAPVFLAVKTIPEDSEAKNEIDLYSRFTPGVLKNKMPHFPIVMGTAKCKACTFENEELEDYGTTRPCYYVFNELANGDLSKWCETTHPEADYFSLIAQSLLALTYLHSFGLAHDDLHYGNMLFHNIPAGGYWYYRVAISKKSDVGRLFGIKKTEHIDIYVRNTGQQWVLWDFGLMKKNPTTNTDLPYVSKWGMWAAEDGRPYPPAVSNFLAKLHEDTKHLVAITTSDIVPLIDKNSTIPSSIVSIGKIPLDTILNAEPYLIELKSAK